MKEEIAEVVEVLAADGLCETVEPPTLSIKHIATGRQVDFKRIKLTSFLDSISTAWNEEEVYGRMDPIATYQGTRRTIDLTFDLGPYTDSVAQSQLAMAKLSRLMQFQYPTYTSTDSATSISRPPLLLVSFGNYIRDATGDALLCYTDSMNYSPVDGMTIDTMPTIVGELIVPQRYSVQLALKILLL